MNIREQVVHYVCELTNETVLDHSMNLFENGILTSLDVLDIISFIEETFKVNLSDDDVSMESFGSIDGLVALISKSVSTATIS